MFKLIISVLLKAIAFAFIFNLISGLHFTGSFWTAICYSIFFSIVAFVVRIALMASIAGFGIATAGAGAVLLIFLYLIGFWIIPAIQLEVLAWWFPKHFTVDGFGGAILGGLVLLVINAIAGGYTRKS